MTTPQEKIAQLNTVGQDIHESILFVDGKLTCQLQVGHPKEPSSISGCFPTHLIDWVIELHEHYQRQIWSIETAEALLFLRLARLALEKRKVDREKRGVLHHVDSADHFR